MTTRSARATTSARRKAGTMARRVFMPCACVAFAGGAVSFFSDTTYWLAFSLVIVMGAVAMSVAFDRFRFLGWSLGISLFYVFTMCVVPALQEAAGSYAWSSLPAAADALWCVAAALAAFVGGALLIGRRRETPASSVVGGSFAPLGSFRMALAVTAVALWGRWYSFEYGNFANVDRERGPFSGVALLAGSLLGLIAAIGWAKTWSAGRSRWTWLALACSVLDVAYGVVSNSKAAILSPLLLGVVVYINVRRTIPTRALVAVAVAYALLAYPFVTMLRQASRARDASELVTESVDLLASRAWLDASAVAPAADSLSRGLLDVLTSIVADEHREWGETYVAGLVRCVPKFVGLERPRTLITNMIGKRYDKISKDDDITNISPSQVGEMYLNFGLAGVLVGMFLTGLLAAWIDGPFTRYCGIAVAAWLWQTGIHGQENVLGEYLATALHVGALWCVLALFSTLRLRRTRPRQLPLPACRG